MKEEKGLSELEQEALQKLLQGASLSGKDGALTPIIKRLLETALGGELEEHLKEEKASGKANRRNGKTKKGIKTEHGEIELETSRDRLGSFEPKLIGKRQTTLGDGLDNKIISMYSMGMSYEDIQKHLEELYGLSLSKAQLSNITDKIWEDVMAWQSRDLESVYPIIWMDALHFKVKQDGQIANRAVYVVIGVNKSGKKDVLSLQLSENEGAKFWLQVLTDLQNRGVKDILIACIDNLSGFSEAIASIFPQTEVQLCVVHQIRNSLKYVTSEDSKPFMKDLTSVYQASTQDLAAKYLDSLDEKWGAKYPVVIRSWRKNWVELTAYFKYSPQIRKIIYTTNTVEGFNRQIRKTTKTKAVFPSDKSLLKLVWLSTQNILEKWTSPVQNWALAAQQFHIHFQDRFLLDLK